MFWLNVLFRNTEREEKLSFREGNRASSSHLSPQYVWMPLKIALAHTLPYKREVAVMLWVLSFWPCLSKQFCQWTQSSISSPPLHHMLFTSMVAPIAVQPTSDFSAVITPSACGSICSVQQERDSGLFSCLDASNSLTLNIYVDTNVGNPCNFGF